MRRDRWSVQLIATTVGVTHTGVYSLAQLSGGTNYWVPSAPYLSATLLGLGLAGVAAVRRRRQL